MVSTEMIESIRMIGRISVMLTGCLMLAVGCGSHRREPGPPQHQATLVRDSAHGLSYRLPAGWHRAPRSLTPHLEDPREELSAATYPLSYRPGGCAHVATSALAELPPSGAFVTVLERGRGGSLAGFPQRPATFGPGLGGPSEASACVPGRHFTDHWFAFADGGRKFHVDVAFGPRASDATKSAAWSLLDSLHVDARVRPSWRSSG